MSYAGTTPQYTSVKSGNLELVGDIVYFGDKDTDGSFRILKDGADLKIQVRLSSVWTDKDIIDSGFVAPPLGPTTQSAFDPSVSSSSNLTFTNSDRTVSSDSNSPPYAISLSQATTTASSKIFASFQCGVATGQSQFYMHFSSVAPVNGDFSSPNLSSIFLQCIGLNSANLNWDGPTGPVSITPVGTFPQIVTGDLVDIAIDLALAKLYIRVNGVWQNGEAGVSGGYNIPPASVVDYTGQQVYKRIGVESGEDYTLTETPLNIPSGYELV